MEDKKMAINLNGSYDGGPNNEYRLTIKNHSEASGSFSGQFHNGVTNAWSNVTGWFNFHNDRQETVLSFSTPDFEWSWQNNYVNGSATSTAPWTASYTYKSDRNNTQQTKCYKE